MPRTLNDRIATCLRSLPGTEDIDELLKGSDATEERSDFLAEARTGIIELKSIEKDMSEQVEKVLTPLREREDAPLVYGHIQVEKLIKHFKDEDEIRRQLYNRVTKSFEQAVRKANRQIQSTKDIFNIPSAWGAILFVNEAVDVLSPEIMAHRANRLLSEKRSGLPRFQHIHSAILVSEAHYTVINKRKSFPIIHIHSRPGKKASAGEAFFERLMRSWAKMNSAPLYTPRDGAEARLPDLLGSFSRSAAEDEKAARGPQTRKEKWRTEYRNNRYMAQMDDEAFSEVLARTIEEASPYFLKGGLSMDESEMIRFWERMSHIFEEASLRGFDMKALRRLNLDPPK